MGYNTTYKVDLNTGAGNDNAIITGTANAHIDLGAGNDYIRLDSTLNGTATGGDGHDAIKLNMTEAQWLANTGGIQNKVSNFEQLAFNDVTILTNSLAEDVANGDEVGILASLNDLREDGIVYSIVDEQGNPIPNGVFEIDSLTGIVTVRDNSQINYEFNDSETIIVKRTLSDNTSTTETFKLTISDANDGPVANDDTAGVGTVQGEILVNTTTAGSQTNPDITGTEDGGYIASWQAPDGTNDGIYIQKFDSSGNPVGSETLVNTMTAYNQHDSHVVGLAGGGVLVTWTVDTAVFANGSDVRTGASSGSRTIRAQIFDENGDAVGANFTVASAKYDPITALDDGGFIVTWSSHTSVALNDGSGWGSFAQRFDASGNEIGNPIQVNTTTVGNQLDTDITVLSDGSIIVTWQSVNQDGSGLGIYAREFALDANGLLATSDEVLVNTTTAGNQSDPEITALSNGGYVITWQSPDASTSGIFAQVYSADGSTLGNEISVNTITAGSQVDPVVTFLPNGFVISYYSAGEIHSQMFNNDGTLSGNEVVVNTNTDGEQLNPVITSLEDGGYIIAWESATGDGAGSGIFTQRFNSDGSAFAPRLSLDANENTPLIINTADLLANDTDEDGDVLTVISVQGDANTHGTVVLNADGTITFTPEANYIGSSSFAYTISDGNGGTSTARVSLKVNDAIEIVNGNVTVVEDTAQVIANAFDNDGTIVENKSTADHGTISIDANGDITYTPDENFNGNDTAYIVLIDDSGFEVTKEISLSVEAVNDAPTAQDDSISAKVNETTTLNVLSNDSDIDGDSFTISKISGQDASAGQIINVVDHGLIIGTARVVSQAGIEDVIEFTASSNYTIDSSFTYTISDGSMESTEATVNLTVSAADGVTIGAIIDSNASVHNVWGQAVQYFYAATYGANVLEIPDLTLVETDGSESIVAVLSSINVGVTLSDGTNTFTATAGNTSVDISSWNTSNITINPSQTILTHPNTYTYGATYRTNNYSDDITLSVKSVVTADGDESDVQNVTLTVNFTESASWISSPMILDLDGDGVETLGVESGVRFDIDADGDKDKTGWVGADDGLLVRDINNDGIINDASELFGEETIKNDGSKASDGYDALAELDSINDGVINALDEQFDELRVWKDSNSDGITQEGELLSLEEANVSEISLGYTQSDRVDNGNIIGLEGTYKDNEGNEKEMADVWFGYDKNLETEAIDLSASSVVDSIIDLTNGTADLVSINFDEIVDTINEDNELIILGDEDDMIALQGGIKSANNADGKWESTGTKEDDEGHTYNVYQSSTGNSVVKLLIDDDIDINNF